jgi:predicted ferric reductase
MEKPQKWPMMPVPTAKGRAMPTQTSWRIDNPAKNFSWYSVISAFTGVEIIQNPPYMALQMLLAQRPQLNTAIKSTTE